MDKLENLKKKIQELLEIARMIANSYQRKIVTRLNEVFDLQNRNLNLRLIIVGVVVCVMVGFFFGFAATKGVVTAPAPTLETGGSRFPFFGLFGKNISFPGTQADGSFVFSNFEKAENLKPWSLIEASMVSTTQYAWEGSFSEKVSFFGDKELAAITLDG